MCTMIFLFIKQCQCAPTDTSLQLIFLLPGSDDVSKLMNFELWSFIVELQNME